MLTQTTFTFGACVTEMPLSSRRDMSVSISPWCLWRCAHRGGGGAGEEIEGCFFVHHGVSPFVYTLSHPSSNLWGEVWGMQSGQEGGGGWGWGGIWACRHGNKGMVDWQHLLLSVPPSAVPTSPPRSSSSTCTCQRRSG